MSSLAATLKHEISRLARKEVRSELATLKKQSAQYRRDIAALKRQADQQERELRFLRKREKARLKKAPAAEEGETARFSAKWLASHRAKLGLSAADYAKLVGVSALSIYKWEQGNTNPQAAQRAKLAAVRGLGKREARKRLEMMES